MEGHDGVVAVVFAGEQGGQTLLVDLRLQLFQGLVNVLQHGSVVIFLGHFDHGLGVLKKGDQLCIAVDDGF